jgi:flagellin-specific chaperone FliS
MAYEDIERVYNIITKGEEKADHAKAQLLKQTLDLLFLFLRNTLTVDFNSLTLFKKEILVL